MIRLLLTHEDARWDDFVLEHPLGTVYHLTAWRDAIRMTYRFEPLYVILERDGRIRAGLCLFLVHSALTGTRLVAVPGAQACDPLVDTDDDYKALIAWATAAMAEKRARSIELRMTSRFPGVAATSPHVLTQFGCHRLSLLPDLATIESRFHRDSIRRRIRRAEASGVTVEDGHSVEDVRVFYGLYLRARKTLGLLPQPLRLFESMWMVLRPLRCVELLHARYQGTVVSSVLLLRWRETMTYESGASDPAFMNLGVSPLLLGEAIRRAKLSQLQVFDFGRTSQENQGLSTFKGKWGAEYEPLRYVFLPELSQAAALREKGFAKRAMSLALTSSPPSVCATLGDLLYRHFA